MNTPGGPAISRSFSAASRSRPLEVVRAAGRFGMHVVEMCLSMCVGLVVLDLPALAIADALGYSDPITQLPELSAIVAAVNMSVPMALWMRMRHHGRQCIREMVAAMAVETVLVIAIATAGLVARESIVAWQHGLMVPAMVAAMLLRLDVYTKPMRHHAAA